MKLRTTDYLHVSNSHFGNFIESWLHLDGLGRRFNVDISWKKHTCPEKVDFRNGCLNVIKCLSYVLLLPITCPALIYRKIRRRSIEKQIERAVTNEFARTMKSQPRPVTGTAQDELCAPSINIDLSDFHSLHCNDTRDLERALKYFMQAKEKGNSESELPLNYFKDNISLARDFGEFLVKKNVIKSFVIGRCGILIVRFIPKQLCK